MKKGFCFTAAAAALAIGGLCAASNCKLCRTRKLKRKMARTVKAVGAFFDHIASAL